jgi:PAS domain S-box-containing protein
MQNFDKTNIDKLFEMTSGFLQNKTGKEFILEYSSFINNVTPYETVVLVHNITAAYGTDKEVQTAVNKLIRVLGKTVEAFKPHIEQQDHFLNLLILENTNIKKVMASIKRELKTVNNSNRSIKDKKKAIENISDEISKIKKYECHYTKKENILFPWLEKKLSQKGCLKLMWEYHNEVRKWQKECSNILRNVNEDSDIKAINLNIGRLFFAIIALIVKEEYILFPVAFDILSDKNFKAMAIEGEDYGYFEINRLNGYNKSSIDKETADNKEETINLTTGLLSRLQTDLLLNHLPMDISFVDHNDNVIYFSSGKERFFPRSKSVIGRNVFDCHPAKSTDKVRQILNDFKTEKRSEAEFWINHNNITLHIRYFAVRDSNNRYIGCLETVQDITEIKKLTGERRLLDDKNQL